MEPVTAGGSKPAPEHESTRGTGAPRRLTAPRETMKAIVHTRYGSPDVLDLRDIDKPALTDDGVLVRVRASSVNPAEWYAVAGRPYVGRGQTGLLKPKSRPLGAVAPRRCTAAVATARRRTARSRCGGHRRGLRFRSRQCQDRRGSSG